MSDPHNDQPKRDASHLFDILDELAGITEEQRRPTSDEELAACEPVPLRKELIECSLQKLRRMQSSNVMPPHRSWWRRPAAVVPISISVVLLAAAPAYYFV